MFIYIYIYCKRRVDNAAWGVKAYEYWCSARRQVYENRAQAPLALRMPKGILDRVRPESFSTERMFSWLDVVTRTRLSWKLCARSS